MNTDTISKLPKKDLVSLITICRRDTRFFDGYWFINIENRLGFEEAMNIHAEMWRRFGKYQGELIADAFTLSDDPIQALVKAVSMDPAWLFWDYTVEQVSNTAALFRVSSCVAQRARIKSSKGINPDCQKVDGAYFESFAHVIDPRIKVKCNFGPPDKYSDELWCEWSFSITPNFENGEFI